VTAVTGGISATRTSDISPSFMPTIDVGADDPSGLWTRGVDGVDVNGARSSAGTLTR